MNAPIMNVTMRMYPNPERKLAQALLQNSYKHSDCLITRVLTGASTALGSLEGKGVSQ